VKPAIKDKDCFYYLPHVPNGSPDFIFHFCPKPARNVSKENSIKDKKRKKKKKKKIKLKSRKTWTCSHSGAHLKKKEKKRKKGMVTSQGGMSEAFTAVVQMATERHRFKKAPPTPSPTKRTRGDVPGGSRFGNALF
jgi:hypothetical protein